VQEQHWLADWWTAQQNAVLWSSLSLDKRWHGGELAGCG